MNPNSSSAETAPSTSQRDRQVVELQSLFEMSKLLNSSLNLHTILSNLLLTPMGRMMISRGCILVKSESHFTVKQIKGLSQDLLENAFPWPVDFSEPRVAEEINNTGITKFMHENGLVLMLPIISSTRTVGIMMMGGKLTKLAFSENELEFLSSLSNIAATAIENALFIQELEQTNRQLDQKVQHLDTLFQVSKKLNSFLDKDNIINLLLFTIMGEMMLNRCFLFLKEGDSYKLGAYKGVGDNSSEIKTLSKSEFLKDCCNISEPIDLEKNTHIVPKEFLTQIGIKALVPMPLQDEIRGVIALGAKITQNPFLESEFEYLTTLGNSAMIAIENARLFDEALEKQRMEEEMNIARDIQQRLLPSSYPDIAGYDIDGMNIPSRQVGGDYVDCLQLDKNRIGLAIGDVSGKGVGASLLMSHLHASLHSLVMTHTDIKTIVKNVNNLIQAHTNFDKFITFFYAEIDLENQLLTFVNAGHNPPFLLRKDGTVKTLETGGLLLGMMSDLSYESETIELKSGDLVYMFTDGVSEAFDDLGNEFEEDRILEILKKCKNENKTSCEIVKQMNAALDDFTNGAAQTDDITMLVMNFD